MAKLTLSEALKKAIIKSELSRYQIAKQARVDQAVISRFLSDDDDQRRDLRLETASKIAEVVGVRLVVDAERTRSSRKKTK
jgi:predicted transcriptional regulator